MLAGIGSLPGIIAGKEACQEIDNLGDNPEDLTVAEAKPVLSNPDHIATQLSAWNVSCLDSCPTNHYVLHTSIYTAHYEESPLTLTYFTQESQLLQHTAHKYKHLQTAHNDPHKPIHTALHTRINTDC